MPNTQRLGLVHEVTNEVQLDDVVQALIGELISGGPSAQAAVFGLLRDIGKLPLDDAARELTAQRIAGLRATPEARESLNAFFEKHKPAWVSR